MSARPSFRHKHNALCRPRILLLLLSVCPNGETMEKEIKRNKKNIINKNRKSRRRRCVRNTYIINDNAPRVPTLYAAAVIIQVGQIILCIPKYIKSPQTVRPYLYITLLCACVCVFFSFTISI